MFNHPRPSAVSVSTCFLMLLLPALFTGSATAAPVGTLIPAPNRCDMIYDHVRDIVYITSGSQILRYKIGTDSFLSPYDCGAGASLMGIDLSPDRGILIACDSSYDNNNNWVRVVNLTTDTVTQQTFPRHYGEAGTFAVAFANDGSAIITSRYSGSGWVPCRRYSPATAAFEVISSVRMDTMPCASADGAVIGLAEASSSGGPWDRYRVADGDFVRAGNTSWFVYEIGVNRNATQYAVPTYNGTYVYNESFGVITKLGNYAGAQPIAAAYHPSKDIVYFPWTSTSTIRAYRTTDLTHVGTYDFGHAFGTPGNHAFAHGRTKLARNGSYLFSTVSGGVRYANATIPTTPTSLVVDKPAPQTGDDVTATAGGSFAPSGFALSYLYEWSRVLSPGAIGTKSSVAPPTRLGSKAWGDHSGPVLPGSLTIKGEYWQVRAQATDGALTSEWLDGPVVIIGNTPPTAPTSVSVSPSTAYCTSTLTATATGGSDPDGDTPLTYQYQWSRGDGTTWEPWGYTSTDGVLRGVTLVRGERWRARARIFDGTNYGPFRVSGTRTVQNTPPTAPTALVTSPDSPTCTSTVMATATGGTDADGDPIVYEYDWSFYLSRSSVWTAWGYTTTSGVLTAPYIRKGERWRVRARTSDGLAASAYFATIVEVTIGDAPPSVPTSLTVAPPAPVCTSFLIAAAGGSTDPDVDDVVSYKYEWSQSGDGAWGAWGHASTNGQLTGVTQARGDVWRVRACATAEGLDGPWHEPVEVTIGNSPPSAPAMTILTPAEPTTAADLAVESTGATDPDQDSLTYSYEWARSTDDGESWVWQSGASVLSSSLTTRDEQWKARGRAFDGESYGPWLESNVVTILNTRPTPPTVNISPLNPRTINDLTATIRGGTDLDGDRIIYPCQWSKSTDGGATWSDWSWRSRFLSSSLTAREEQWRARARCYDGTGASEWVISAPVTILNTAPRPPTEITVAPSDPGGDDDLVATATGSVELDEGDTISYEYRWRRSTDAGATWSPWRYHRQTVPASFTWRGDWWQVRARATDGLLPGPWRGGPVVTISNAPAPVAMTVAATATKSGHVAIIVHLAGAATVEGVVCNLAGRTVAALPACALPEGRSTLFWNSRATSGLAAPAGTYLLRLKARGSDGGQTQSVASVSLRR